MSNTKISLIPGAAGLASFWDPIRERLPRSWQQQSFDLPGFGPVPANPAISSYAALVEHIASQISAPGVVAGHSMGGYLALQLALSHPELVTHLVLVVAAGGMDMQQHGAKNWRTDYGPRRQNPDWIFSPVPDLTPELSRIRVPVLLIWATRDPISPLSVAQQLERELPDARLLSFDTDDHWVARCFPDETASAIIELVQNPR